MPPKRGGNAAGPYKLVSFKFLVPPPGELPNVPIVTESKLFVSEMAMHWIDMATGDIHQSIAMMRIVEMVKAQDPTLTIVWKDKGTTSTFSVEFQFEGTSDRGYACNLIVEMARSYTARGFIKVSSS